MLRKIDRSASVLLAVFAFGHAVPGTLLTSPFLDPSTMWSFSGSVAAWAIAALNWLRSSRPGDRALAAWALAGALTWIGLMKWLMAAASMWADPRPWLFIAVCTILAVFSLAGALGRPLSERPGA
jgi:Na+/proline symporter